MKTTKNTFKLNKQKVASLDKELKNSVKAGSVIRKGFTDPNDPTVNTFCFVCTEF